MAPHSNLPVESKAIRFAPGRDLKPAASFWKVWTQGNEIYALVRNSGEITKISVHQSGQIHFRLGPKNKTNLMPMMQIGSSSWLHAIEIRFLLSEDAGAPPDESRSVKKKSAYVIPVSFGKFLVVNLMVGSAGTSWASPLPTQFSGAQLLWRAALPDRRLAILVGRVLDLDQKISI